MTRSLRAWAALAALSFVGPACGQSRTTRPPYARGQAPTPQQLLEAGAPSFSDLKVPKAKIREGRSPAARLLLLAEGPERLLGTIEIAGNPLVSLSMHEEGYALRNMRDAPGLRAGFYFGPPSRCAVRSLLGVDMDPEALVRMLLGGAPLIDDPYEVVDQRWADGREQLILRNGSYEERVDFAWLEGRWWFAGASMYALESGEARWLWTFRHSQLRAVAGGVLPGETQISRPVPGKRKAMELSITWLQQIASTRDAKGESTGATDTDTQTDPIEDPGWNDEGWEDEGWDEGDDNAADEGDDNAADEGDLPVGNKANPEQRPLPAAYRLEPAGLPDRGDLCR